MKKFIILFLILLFFILIYLEAYSYSNIVSSNLSDTFFRLHIVANSNSKEDQMIKIKIRDQIISYLNNLIPNYNSLSKDEIINLTKSNLSTITSIANKTLNDNNLNYQSVASINKSYFPTKNYYNLALPAGYYDSLIINLGESNGKNWWCSLYPPLCFAEISDGCLSERSNKQLQASLSKNDYCLITDANPNIKFKFKLIEFFNK